MVNTFLEMKVLIDNILINEPTRKARELCLLAISMNPVAETRGSGRRCSSCTFKNSNRTQNCLRCNVSFSSSPAPTVANAVNTCVEMRVLIDHILANAPTEHVRSLSAFLMGVNPVAETRGPGKCCSSCKFKNSNKTQHCLRCHALFVPRADRRTVAPPPPQIGLDRCRACPQQRCPVDHPKGPPVKMLRCGHLYHRKCYESKKSRGSLICSCNQGELPQHD